MACQLLLQCELVGNDNLGGVVARVSPLARLHGGAAMTGMVISNDEGNIKMLHSSSSLGIVIESLNNSPYYISRYLGAGRIPEVKEHWKGIPHELNITE